MIGSLMVVAFSPSQNDTQDVLACTTEFNFTRNEGKPSEVKVNAIAQFYVRADGTGLTTYKGASRIKGKEMIVDRDVNFTWERRTNDHVIMLTYKNTLRRHNDNTPDALWGSFARPGARYYITLSKLSSSVWMIQDRLYPTYICRED
ncbi:Uncharacterised protein [Enterobacter cloacae]|nr:Uncharacterised protein [Enterobacter cloacae]